MNYLNAHAAAVESLSGYGITALSAEEIISRMEDSQAAEWQRTLERVAAGEAKRVRLFVVWNDIQNFNTFLYSGDQDSTVAYLFKSLSEVVSGEQVDEGAGDYAPVEPQVEGYNKVACSILAGN